MIRVAVAAPPEILASCQAWAIARGTRSPGRHSGGPAQECWVFSIGGGRPAGILQHVPMKFFAVVGTDPLEVLPLPHLPANQIPTPRELLPPKAHAAETARSLAAIAAALEAGANYGDLDAELDELLGTEMEERDPDIEAEYEMALEEARDVGKSN